MIIIIGGRSSPRTGLFLAEKLGERAPIVLNRVLLIVLQHDHPTTAAVWSAQSVLLAGAHVCRWSTRSSHCCRTRFRSLSDPRPAEPHSPPAGLRPAHDRPLPRSTRPARLPVRDERIRRARRRLRGAVYHLQTRRPCRRSVRRRVGFMRPSRPLLRAPRPPWRRRLPEACRTSGG